MLIKIFHKQTKLKQLVISPYDIHRKASPFSYCLNQSEIFYKIELGAARMPHSGPSCNAGPTLLLGASTRKLLVAGTSTT